ncbi:MAG: hypothetical protein ACI4HI_12795 [Lachnospiraceae bacterium]
MQGEKEFIGYEYKEIIVPEEQVAMYLDCYENFGWIPEENAYVPEKQIMLHGFRHLKIQMKRNRKIINKMELTRLQRNFEACANEIKVLEGAKTRGPLIWAMTVGLVGTAFMAGSTFVVVHEPPIVWLCVLLAIPGFIGWIVPYFLYRRMVEQKEEIYNPLIEEKLDEIYKICEKGHSLL